jgi:hypothetical protein
MLQATCTRSSKNGQAGELTPHCDGLKEKKNCTEMDGRHIIDSFDDLESKFRNPLSFGILMNGCLGQYMGGTTEFQKCSK